MAEILLPPASVGFRGRPLASAAFADGRCKIEAVKLSGETVKNPPKWQKLGRGGENIAALSFRQLPLASADVRGHPRHVRTEDVRWEMENYEGKHRNIPYMAETRAGWKTYCFRQLPRTSVDIRGRQWTSAACVDRRWKLGNYEGKQRKITLNGRN